MTATLSGPRYRAFIYDIHQQMGCLLEASTAAHLSEEEASNCNITQLPPLSWEKDSTDESGTLFSQPLSTENFDEMIKQRNIGRKAEWKAMVKRRDMRCGLPKTHCHPWSAARTRNISHAQGRRKVGEEMVRLFREQLKTTWFGSQNLTSSGGWRTLYVAKLCTGDLLTLCQVVERARPVPWLDRYQKPHIHHPCHYASE